MNIVWLGTATPGWLYLGMVHWARRCCVHHIARLVRFLAARLCIFPSHAFQKAWRLGEAAFEHCNTSHDRRWSYDRWKIPSPMQMLHHTKLLCHMSHIPQNCLVCCESSFCSSKVRISGSTTLVTSASEARATSGIVIDTNHLSIPSHVKWTCSQCLPQIQHARDRGSRRRVSIVEPEEFAAMATNRAVVHA